MQPEVNNNWTRVVVSFYFRLNRSNGMHYIVLISHIAENKQVILYCTEYTGITFIVFNMFLCYQVVSKRKTYNNCRLLKLNIK